MPRISTSSSSNVTNHSRSKSSTKGRRFRKHKSKQITAGNETSQSTVRKTSKGLYEPIEDFDDFEFEPSSSTATTKPETVRILTNVKGSTNKRSKVNRGSIGKTATVIKRKTSSPRENIIKSNDPYAVKNTTDPQDTLTAKTYDSSNNHKNETEPVFTLPKLPLPLLSHAVGFDTRKVQTFIGDASWNMFYAICLEFLYMANTRGILPVTVGTSFSEDDNVTVRATNLMQDIQYHYYSLFPRKRDFTSLQKLIAPALVKDSNIHLKMKTTDNDSSNEPNAFNSWSHFSNLVREIVSKTPNTKQNTLSHLTSPQHPLDIIVFSTDIIFFSYNTPDKHKGGVLQFWADVKHFFTLNRVISITIYIIDTNLHTMIDEAGEEDIDAFGKVANTLERETNRQNACETKKHLFQCFEAIHAIQNQLSQLHSNIKEASPTEGNEVNINFEIIDSNAIGLSALLRSWTRECFPVVKISFSLPELIDGTQCSISLDLEYTTLQYPVNSLLTYELIQSSKLLADDRTHFEVIQLVKVEDVDASLLYGNSMSARPGLEGDLFQHKEMETLVGELWKWLDENDCCLLIKCTVNDMYMNKSQNHNSDQIETGDISYFILMTEKAKNDDTNHGRGNGLCENKLDGPQTLSDQPTCNKTIHGILFRYGMDDTMLRDLENEKMSIDENEYSKINLSSNDTFDRRTEFSQENDFNNSKGESMSQYYDYIDKSLLMLDKKQINPSLFGHESRANRIEGIIHQEHKKLLKDCDKFGRKIDKVQHEDKVDKERKRWEQKSGVGASTCYHEENEEQISNTEDESVDGSMASLEISEYM